MRSKGLPATASTCPRCLSSASRRRHQRHHLRRWLQTVTGGPLRTRRRRDKHVFATLRPSGPRTDTRGHGRLAQLQLQECISCCTKRQKAGWQRRHPCVLELRATRYLAYQRRTPAPSPDPAWRARAIVLRRYLTCSSDDPADNRRETN
jgi:hypothetical protein